MLTPCSETVKIKVESGRFFTLTAQGHRQEDEGMSMLDVSVTLLDRQDLLLVLQHLQASPNLFTFLDSDIAEELQASDLFDVSEWRITGRARDLLSHSK